MISLFAKFSDKSSRVILVIAAIIACNLIVVGRLFEIAMGNSPDIRYLPTASEQLYKRANIVDRNGKVVAMNIKTASLYANPQEVIDDKALAKALHKLFPEQSYKSILKKLGADNQFQWIARHITPKKQELINELGAIGLVMIDDIKRIYPNKNNLSHILGNVDLDNNGISGIEKEFDNFLKYADTQTENLQLTIDIRIQEIVRNVLISHIERQDALGGSVIIMDPNSGEVIAMVSAPDYDPNHIAVASDDQKFNRNTVGLYEPGSTMKAFTVAAAIDSGRVNTSGVFNVSEPLRYGRFKIRDLYPKGDELSVPEILMYSSNIGVVKVNDKIGTGIQKYYLEKFGFFRKMNVEIAEKAYPIYPKKDSKWGAVRSATISYGHGIAISPLHLISAYTSLVNGGYYAQPKLVKKTHNVAPQRVLNKETSNIMRRLLRKVVLSGSVSRAEVRGYLVGGKTGSAEKNENGKYLKNSNVSSFCGAFPMNNPKYLVYVMLDGAKKNDYNKGFTTGGRIAAPLAKEVIESIVGTLGLPPQENLWELEEELKPDFTPQYKKVAYN